MSETLKTKGSNRILLQEAPQLQEGVNLLISDDSPVQRLVAGELEFGGEAVWIDAGNESSTYQLAEHGREELLQRVKIARSFTPFQHHTAVSELEEFIENQTKLLVFTNIDALYLDGQLGRREAEELFAETLEVLVQTVESKGVKALVTVAEEELEFKLEVVADKVIESGKTDEGRRFSSGGFRTKAYRDSGAVQTSLDLWEAEEVREDGEDELDLQKPSRQHS